jgi:hypothetical protein
LKKKIVKLLIKSSYLFNEDANGNVYINLIPIENENLDAYKQIKKKTFSSIKVLNENLIVCK